METVREAVDVFVMLMSGCELFSDFKERLEDSFAILEVVVDDVDEVPVIHDICDKLARS